jgi:hypothetical protein
MRRPYRLHRGPSEEDTISQFDFRLDVASYAADEIHQKEIANLAFVWLCKLSEIMAAIAVFQQQTRFSREWNGESIRNSISELVEVTAFDRDIRKWKDEFEADVDDVIGNQPGLDDQDVPIPVSILRIVCK